MKEDLRILKTKEKLYTALGELMKNKTYEKISVSDIVRESGVTRKTFYNHYQDKLDLVLEYQYELIEYIRTNIIHGKGKDSISVLKLTRYLSKQDYLLTALLSQNGSLAIQNSFRDILIEYCHKSMQDSISDSIDLEYRSVLTAGALFSVIQHWLVTGKKISPKKLSIIISKLTLFE